MAEMPMEDPIELGRLLDALRRSRVLIAGILVVLTGGVFAVSLALPKSYQATAKLVLVGDGVTESPDADSLRRQLSTLRALATTPDVLRRAARQLDGETRDTLETKVHPSIDPDANVIDVTATDSEASGAARIANTVARTFLEEQAETERRRVRQERAGLVVELNRLRASGEPAVQISAIRSRLSELAVMEVRAGSGLAVAELAEPPANPHSPHPVRNAVLAFLAGVLIAVLAALGRQSLSPRVGSAAELSRLTSLPLLNKVPHGNSGPTRWADSSDGKRLEGPDQYTRDAYQSLRVSIAVQLPRRRQQILLVTSPCDEESKADVVAGLGRALAEAGSATLLVSADIRRPGLDRLFGIPQAPGLADVLAGLRTSAESNHDALVGAIRRLPSRAGEGILHILPSGATPAGPAAHLTTDGLDQVLERISRLEYGYVLIDGPPLLPLGEGQILARRVDRMLIASRPDQLKVADAVELHATLDRLDLRPLGLATIEGQGAGPILHRRIWLRLRRWLSARAGPIVTSARSRAGGRVADASQPTRPEGVQNRPPDARYRPSASMSDGVPDESVNAITSRERRILRALTSFARPVKEEELRAVLGYSRSTILRQLERLGERGDVVRSGNGRRGDPYLYEPGSRARPEAASRPNQPGGQTEIPS
jgi:polysaccharide biosynthesis transport protein